MLFTAQRDYARIGDKDLSELLVGILVDRSALEERSLKQIVLNEAIAVAPKLSSEQFDILSLCFIVQYTRQPPQETKASCEDYRSKVLPFIPSIPRHDCSYQHLAYTGCASIGLDVATLGNILQAQYPGVFTAFTADHIEDYFVKVISGGERIVETWNESLLRSLRLTTVGIAIAHANIRRKLRQDNYDLGLWIK
jgi:hypothetical protein